MLPNKLCFVDIETTGGSLSFDRIIEIGILRVENNKVTKTFHSLINPGGHIPESILQLTGISTQEIDHSPSFYELRKEIQEVLNDALFVAHNARFDFCFLKQEFKRLEIDFSPKQLCTVKLSRKLFPEYHHHNLDSLIERFNLHCPKRHRAFEDADVLWQFYQLIQEKFSVDVLEEALNKVMKRPTIPIKISEEVFSSLPETPGVYIFYGQNKSPLYIGKSINIRKRVLNHFSSDHLSSKELTIAQQVETIECIPTAGELGALLKESELVKKVQPIYNRQLRKNTKLTILSSRTNKLGYQEAFFQETEAITINDISQVLAIFKGRRQATNALINLAKEFGLCEKLLRVESCKEACFGYRLGRCKGACIGKEHPLKYNLRFQEAFYHLKISSWPFSGAIKITERDSFRGVVESFIFDRWCYLGKITGSETDQEMDLLRDVEFDLDMFKILRQFIRLDKNKKSIASFNKPITKRESSDTDYQYLSDGV